MRYEMKKADSVLIVTERFYPEEFGINDLTQAWQAQGVKVAVLTQTPSYPFDRVYEGYQNKLFQIEDWKGVRIYRVRSLLGYKKNVLLKVLNYIHFVFFASLAAFFIGRKYENIFVYHIGPLTQAIPAVLIKKLFKKRIYVWTLDVWPDSVYAYGFKERLFTKKVLDLIIKSIYKNCDKVFISCRGFTQKIKKYASNATIILSPQWAPYDLNFSQVSSGKLFKEGFNFTFAGNIGKVQNLENVMKGFARIKKNDHQINLNIVGDGSNLVNLKRLAQTENMSNVFFWGRKPLREMPAWLKSSDVLIISLIDEPIFSLTVPAKFQAYLVSGKPIYCIMRGDTADLVMNNKIGLIAQPADIDGITRGFEEFLNTSEQELAQFRANARILADREFDHTRIISRMTREIFQ